jgi:hypothetical protein
MVCLWTACGSTPILPRISLALMTKMKLNSANKFRLRSTAFSRRDFVQSCALGALALASGPVLASRCAAAGQKAGSVGPASRTINLDQDWRFGGKFNPATQEVGCDDTAYARITLPHCVSRLSWQNWDPVQWADAWIYRRHFQLPPESKNLRVFLDFDGVMTGAAPVLNGHVLPPHLGGYLPFGYEITEHLASKDNVLSVAVDGRWQSVPPEGSPKGPAAVDYLEPAAIHRPVNLRVVPPVFIRDVFAKPVKVLDPDRRVKVGCTLDAALIPAGAIRVKADLRGGGRVIASATQEVRIDKTGETAVGLTICRLGNIGLRAPETPRLYEVVVTLLVNDQPWHDYRTRIGFREARFELDGFFLNGRRLQIFGLDRHEIFPYVGVREPLPGVPYFLAEGVGQFGYGKGKGGFGRKYCRAGDLSLQQQQAIWHAQIHDRGQRTPRNAGVVAWCAFDYASLVNPYNVVKCPGVADVFRIPKLGASMYQAQVDPKVRPVIQPNFYWDFGPNSPSGPGDPVAIFSNCERLELWVNGKLHATAIPNRQDYPHLEYPPFFSNLTLDGVAKPELRIDGFLGKKRVLSRSFSSDTTQDKLWLKADDAELIADGSDATRLVFRAVDKFGAPRPFVGGEVALALSGPGVIVGDNPFRWDDSGGAGAVWIRTVLGSAGHIRVSATHAALGKKSVEITVRSVG